MSKEDFTRFENITIDEIYHPRLVSAFYRLTAIFTGLNTLVLPIMCYIIHTQSKKQMGNYKHLLNLQLCVDYIFNLVTFTLHPVLLWPMLLGFSDGMFNLNTDMTYIFLFAEIVLMIWIAIIQVYLLFYRFLAMFQKTFIHLIYRNDFIFAGSLICSLVTSCALALCPFLIDPIDANEVRRLSANDVPALRELASDFTRIIGFYPKLSNGNIYVFVNGLAIAFFAVPAILIIFAIILTVRLQKLKVVLTPQTYAMHRMLHKAMLVQLLIVTLLFLLPLGLLTILLFFEFSWGSYIIPMCVSIVHLHLPFESLNLLYFIKPYRVFMFNKLLNRKYWLRALARYLLSKPPMKPKPMTLH